MSKKRALLIYYLERVSSRIMEEHPDLVREIMRGRSGVYALYRKDRLYYAGLASNMMGRIKTHIRDRHKGLWDRFSIYLTPDDQYMRELEALLLRISRPEGNRMGGRFRGATDLHRQVSRAMASKDADRRASLLGGHIARRRRRSKTSERRGTQALKGLIDRRLSLRAWYKDKEYRATLRKNGLVSFAGQTYRSPSAAARAVVKRAANGWAFWHYRDRRDWVPLDTLRH